MKITEIRIRHLLLHAIDFTEKLERMDRSRLARECSKLDVAFEQSVAEEGMAYEVEEWPEY